MRLLLFCFAVPAIAQSLADCQKLKRHGQVAAAQGCYGKVAASSDIALRAEGLWGLHKFADANEAFRSAVKANPGRADVRVRWGRMFLERYQSADAAALFQEALKLDPKNAGAMLGLALLASNDYEKKAVDMAHAALAADPKLLEAQELLAYLALEDNNEERAKEEANKALDMSDEALDALAVRASIDALHDQKASPWMTRLLKVNPVYGEAYATAGHFFVINRRYVEGIEAYRRALELNPQLWEARSELGINLMRLGQETEARQQLEQCYAAGFKNAATVNSLRLLDSYKNFETFRTPTTILRLQKKEAALLRPYFQIELDRAMATYERKYQVHLTAPVQVEVYPDHEDFAVRTMGMPGLGALGVTFGTVVAMDSPSGRKPGSFHWASTMWHELSHVYVLTATNHRVPRWFTEGMAVHEETAASPDWGDRLDPTAIQAIEKKELLPVAELDRGFVRPSYPTQVLVSYFQAGKICDYIQQKWGDAKLLDMMHRYADRQATPEVIEASLGLKPEQFDQQFLAWLDAQTHSSVSHFAEWKKRARVVADDLKAKKYDEAIAEGQAIRDFYPEYVEQGGVYEMLAQAFAEKGDKSAAMAQLERYSALGGRDPGTIKRLATLQQEAGQDAKAAATLRRLNYIYPEDEVLHRKLGDLDLKLNDIPGAIREYQALLASKPIDPVNAHYELAKAYRAAQRNDDAREQVLLSLEAAPGYKPAQQLLLELSK